MVYTLGEMHRLLEDLERERALWEERAYCFARLASLCGDTACDKQHRQEQVIEAIRRLTDAEELFES
jgi:hypothetical protein